ncbi:MAG: amino acid transporter [Gammaproteobacteria bacterium HGW-Gammaproteobacteria-1]|nr:MAG: amino acid transporter [Gammaproteobacteria bacterium HGW-Gammaproteobacteria-1]
MVRWWRKFASTPASLLAGPHTLSQTTDNAPTLIRAVSRWQIVGLSINDVIGSGIYLLPAAAAALLGPASLWAVLLAGLAASLLVLCYAQAASYFDQAGGAYLYTREAFGDFIGFEVGWMAWLTRIASIAALANGLALAMSALWPAAAHGPAHTAVIVLGIGAVTWVNVVGVKSGAQMAVVLTLAKLADWGNLSGSTVPVRANLTEAALLLLFAYAGFENTPAAAAEYENPKRDVPFAMLTMIAVVTLTYVAIQAVALGTLPNLATSTAPLAEAAGRFAGPAAVLLLTLGAVVSILGNIGNSVLMGPRYLYALAVDGYGPALFARVHPRWHTPVAAIVVPAAIALALALSGDFVQLALLSVVARLATYIGTAASLLVLQKRYADKPGALVLPGGRLIPLLALAVSLVLLLATTTANLLAGAAAIGVGAVVYRLRRR